MADAAPTLLPFMELPDLAAERTGGAVLWANDDFFAEKENLLKAAAAVFVEGKYTDRGKWMDGWESRRRRVPGHDRCIVRLGLPGVIRGVVVDTAFFRGNFPQACSIEGASFTGQPTEAQLLADDVEWSGLLPKVELRGDTKNVFPIASATEARITHLRFNIFPDGGVARLRVHGEPIPEPRFMGKVGATVDLAALEHGAQVVLCNDMFFGSRHNLILPGPSTHMGDGWETRRSRKDAPDWALLKLAGEGELEHLEVDTSHFKGNFPESCALYGAAFPEGATPSVDDKAWQPVLGRTKLMAHTRHRFDELLSRGPYTHLRLDIFPDGGIARLRVFGSLTSGGREFVALRHLRLLSRSGRASLLLAMCGSKRWVDGLVDANVSDKAALFGAAEASFAKLDRDDWLEAFRAHPKIGQKKAHVDTGAQAAAFASGEQARVADAKGDVLSKLSAVNEAYETRFGFIYIVCATGKSADEMLAIAEERMTHEPAREITVAADEQKKITRLRLEKFLAGRA